MVCKRHVHHVSLGLSKTMEMEHAKTFYLFEQKKCQGMIRCTYKKIFCFTFFIPPHFFARSEKICCVCDVDEKKMKVILYTVVFSQKRDQGLYRKNTLNLRYFIIIYFCLLYFILTLVNDVFWFYFLYYLKRKLFWQTSFEF